MRFTLGDYKLVFDPKGKLVDILVCKCSLLYQSDYRFDLGDGRILIPGGWDECFPSILPFKQFLPMGQLIDRMAHIVGTSDSVIQVWGLENVTIERRFCINDKGLLLHFCIQNKSKEDIDFLWVSHAVFDLSDVTEIRLSDGQKIDDFSVDNTVSNFFCIALKPIVITKNRIVIKLQTDQPYWRIWLNRGGWPAANPAGFVCIGIEATSDNSDIPTGRFLAAEEKFCGKITLIASKT